MDHICQPLLPLYLILLRQSPLKVINLCQNCLTSLSLDDEHFFYGVTCYPCDERVCQNIACDHVDTPGKNEPEEEEEVFFIKNPWVMHEETHFSR